MSTHTSLNGAGRISLRRLWEEGCSAFFAPRTSIYEKPWQMGVAHARHMYVCLCLCVSVCSSIWNALHGAHGAWGASRDPGEDASATGMVT